MTVRVSRAFGYHVTRLGLPRLYTVLVRVALESVQWSDCDILLSWPFAQQLGWSRSIPQVEWKRCKFVEGRVITLDISALELPSLPEYVDKLTELYVLDCSKNKLTEFPESLGRLSKLYILDCSENKLVELPDSVGEIEALSHLWCENNRLSKLPDSIGKCTGLAGLRCENNRLSRLPDSIGKLQKLVYLNCGNNQLTSLPVALRRCTSLRRIVGAANLVIRRHSIDLN